MDLYDLMDLGVAAVAADATLKSSCQSWYGADQRVFIDQDKDDPPDPSAGPLIQFHSPGKRADEERRTVEYEYFLAVDVFDNTSAERTEANATEFSGTERLNDIVARVITVIRGAKPAAMVMGYEIATDTISLWPVITADVHIILREDLVIGQDPLA